MLVAYEKPHKNLNEQVAIMQDRGMDTGELEDAVAYLKRIGYYRLSAYSYPLRQWSGEGSDAERAETFIEGTTLDQVVRLHDFDRKIRTLLLDGLGQVEVGMRYAISYTLGKRDPYGHLDVAHLDRQQCSDLQNRNDPSTTRLEHWQARFDRRIKESRNEDFVRHFNERYAGEMPIWVAAEVLDFGGLVSLHGLLKTEDKRDVARSLGFEGANTGHLHKHFVQLNVLRNHCAHQSRIWNRQIVYRSPISKLGKVPDSLKHLSSIPADNSNKLYTPAAVTAHITEHLDPKCNWRRTFATQIKKMPEFSDRITYATMGFPEGWKSEALWS